MGLTDRDIVSIVIPVYNKEAQLSRCLDSVLAQTYSKLEVILVDDGSTDSSAGICRGYEAKDERIRL
ncbi:MAG: glycosyltransferase family 2 protein, partial [Lachnospiraceae bacterium]|nr:glycosyltransferase family 2 protein [Lachnospiraceae bacterium]